MLNISKETKEECNVLDYLAWNETFRTKNVLASLVALTAINTIGCILTVFFNALNVLVVVREPKSRTNSKILLACLAGNDLLTGGLTLPLQIARETRHILGGGLHCDVDSASMAAVFLSCLNSLAHTALLSFDRYVAIKYPLQYRSVVTRRRLYKAVLVAWAVPLVHTVLPIPLTAVAGKTLSNLLLYIDVAVTCFLLSKVVGIIYMNGAIWLEIRRHRKHLESVQNVPTRRKRSREDMAETTVAKTGIIIASALILSYVPTATVFAFRGILSRAVHERGMYVLHNVANTSLLLISLLNPMIYSWRIKEFRDAIVGILLPSRRGLNRSAAENNFVDGIEMQCQHELF